MERLHPSLWRTCRVLANEKRLLLLWQLFRDGELSVSQLGDAAGLSEPVASSYLRAINARGIIQSRRDGKHVFYRTEANPEVVGAVELLEGVKASYDAFMPIPRVMLLFTAFTHERRITLVKALEDGPAEEVQVAVRTGISPQALYRHVKKLEKRGYVEKAKGRISLVKQQDALAGTLLRLAVHS